MPGYRVFIRFVGLCFVSAAAIAVSYSDKVARPTAPQSGAPAGATALPISTPAPPGSAIFVGAGDIASCVSNGDESTAALLDSIPGTVFTLGDNVYESGTPREYQDCYEPTWGRHKARTRPAPGNHDYDTRDAAGYFGYFGSSAGDPLTGYYSFDLADWHIIVLNSNIARSAGSLQERWLRADLASHKNPCTLAYWHHPRFSSGAEHGDDPSVGALWQALYDGDADIVLGGHDHEYERFVPQTPAGAADPVRGIREFVVGTGGRSHYSLGRREANSEIFDAKSFGVLKLTLSPGLYTWQFIPIAGQSFTDSGSGVCH
jgi:hypothetical protein